MNVLVTGGSGFIGSHLCDFLIQNGNRVICIDNFITSDKKNISHLLDNNNFEFIKQDINKEIDLDEKIDQIYNMASPASPVDYQNKAIETLLVGSCGVKNVLDLALKNKATFLQASTSEVYGDPLEHPQTEEYRGNVSCIGPRSCYDESKRFGEALTVAYQNKYDLDIRIVRIFNTYGPRMRKKDGRVIPNFIDQALKNKPLTIYGTGKQTRSFCYISDLITGLYTIMNSDYKKPINLGNPDEHTIKELAEIIIELSNSNSELEFRELPEDDPLKRKPNIEKVKKIGWCPKVSLKEGLAKTIDYFENN